MCTYIEYEYDQTEIIDNIKDKQIDKIDQWKNDLDKFLDKVEYGDIWKKFDYITEDIDKSFE